MGSGSRGSDRVPAGYSRPDEGLLESSSRRPKWLWGWVVVYFLLTVLAVLLIGLWVGNSGGAEWGNVLRPNLMFNLHPLFMVLGFIVVVGHTNLFYRFWPNANSLTIRIAHGTMQFFGWILLVVGVYAAGASKDYAAAANPGHPAKHFVTVHSWVGLTVLIVMTLQFVCGFFGLLVPCCKGERRAAYRSTHIFTGNVIFLLGCAQVLIGLDHVKASATTNTLALTVAGYAILGGYLLSTSRFKKAGTPAHVAIGAASDEERTPLAAPGGRTIYV